MGLDKLSYGVNLGPCTVTTDVAAEPGLGEDSGRAEVGAKERQIFWLHHGKD